MSNLTQQARARAQQLIEATKSVSDSDEMHLPPLKLPPNLTFGPFPITASQAFHVSPSSLTYALVNLRPLLPGHTLVCPVRRVPRLNQLSDQETSDLFLTVKRVSNMLERVFKADALNVAVQDGVAAGQSVPHVHVHIIPRRGDDVVRGDEVYERMDSRDGNLGEVWEEYYQMQRRRRELETHGHHDIESGEEAEARRRNRTEDEMKKEAEWLRWEMNRQEEIGELRKGDAGADDGSGEIP